MIKEAYVSFEVAKLLKEKGFDESVRCRYDNFQDFHEEGVRMKNTDCLPPTIMCPTHQMAMQWLREVHGIHLQAEEKCFCETSHDGMRVKKLYWHWCPNVNLLHNSKVHEDGLVSINNKMDGIYADTYEKAVEAAIKYVLENLI